MADPNCSLCHGTGYKIVERNGMEGAEKCVCMFASRAATLLEAANIPGNYRDATLETFDVTTPYPPTQRALGETLREVKAFVKKFPAMTPSGLLLIGEPGTGKTHLAIGAMKALLERGHECVFFDYQNLLDKIRSGYDASSGTSDREAYRTALDAEVLVLDDLGAHRVTEWVEDTVTSIITYRCNHRKALIATTNLPDADVTGKVVEHTGPGGSPLYKKTLPEMIGVRARSRLFEMCRFVKMPAADDYRLKTTPR